MPNMATKRSTSNNVEGSPKRSRINPRNETGQAAKLPLRSPEIQPAEIRPTEVESEQTLKPAASVVIPLQANIGDEERREVNGGKSDSIPAVSSDNAPPVLSREAPATTSSTAPAVAFIPLESGASDSKGSRHAMEDKCSHFAVYDGHGGRKAAEFASANLHQAVMDAGLPLDQGWHDGSTAVCVWVMNNTVVVANLGDAKAILARGPTPLKGVVVTKEHKPLFPLERKRIEQAGGVVSNGRLQGRLEVSRALGDRQFKKVIAADDAVNFVDKQLQNGASAQQASSRLVRHTVEERKCQDNCTAIIIVFKHNGEGARKTESTKIR